MNERRFQILYALLALVGVMFIHDLWVGYRQVAVLPYSQFQQLVREKKVAEVKVGEDRLEGTLKEPLDGKTRFITNRVGPELAKELDDAQVKYSGTVENRLVEMLLSWLLPVLLFGGVWLLIARRMAGRLGPGGGLMAIGKSKAKVFVETDVQVRFGDVAGVDEAKGELQEVVSYLKDPESYGRLGGRLPKGILLVGPPGTGKTLLAKAVAGEAHVPFFSISGSEFVEMFVGVGAARVRDLFEQARAKAPAIIFIDELDALGRARGANLGMGGHDEKEQTLNQLLVEMDGFDTRSGLVLLAATNRPDVLDPALLRAGRFDRQVLVDRPDRTGRAAILRVHVGKVKLAPGVNLEDVAALTAGFSGADLANLVNEAALAATRRHAEAVERVDFDVAVERIVAGLEKKTRLLNAREREFVAFHEMGHALVAAASPGADPVHKVSIIPRGLGALGYTMQRPTEDRFLMTRAELEGRLSVLLGGRAAEALVFQHTSTGAADDLSRATDIARDMATRFAMVPGLGPVTYEAEPAGFLGPQPLQRRDYSEQTAREIDLAVRDIVSQAFARSEALLRARRQTLERAARLLLERETLVDADLKVLFEEASVEASRTPRAA
ncbi:MAG: ATP-dependent zinc metalloprotease FtsH [Myxococcaceae bacterium]